jgi:hypothetical protein
MTGGGAENAPPPAGTTELIIKTNKRDSRVGSLFKEVGITRLLGNLGNNTSTNGAATFADSEVKTLVHGDSSEQLNLEG